MAAVFQAGGQQQLHVGDTIPPHIDGIAVELHNLMVFGECFGYKVIVIAVILLLGMADAIHIRVFGHSQPQAGGFFFGQQTGDAGAVDGCHNPIQRPQTALGKIQPAVCVHHIGLRAVHHRNTVQYQRQSRLVGKMPHVRSIRHSRAVVGNGQRRIAEGGGFGGHFI